MNDRIEPSSRSSSIRLRAFHLWLLVLIACPRANAKVVVFWQDGFPAVDSQPVARETLEKALDGTDPVFAGIDRLKDRATLQNANLLVMPYGSAVPAEAFGALLDYLRAGGNLLVIGGRPFRVPISAKNSEFVRFQPQDTYSRQIGIRHAYEVPQKGATRFAWEPGYSFLGTPAVRARKFFALEGGLRGLGYMIDHGQEEIAAPVVVMDHTALGPPGQAMLGSRQVMLDFEPAADYWGSSDGIALIRGAADYARQGATLFWLETPYAAFPPGESPEIVVHLRNALKQRRGLPQTGVVKLELRSAAALLGTAEVSCEGDTVDASAQFSAKLSPGFYTVSGVYEDGGGPLEFYRNGFWVADKRTLDSGPVLGVKGDFLTRDGKPYFPFGTNYFSTEENGWDFSGPRNAWVWEKDFAEMEQHGVTFVRTGVWMGQMKFLDPSMGGVSERFLDNLEGYLLAARHHHIAVNFTFFAFDPQTVWRARGEESMITGPGTNPYTDPVAIRAQQNYLLSIVSRFKGVPFLCWDLINEPSFSNPKRLWKGNTPNADPTEAAAWRQWLREKYGTIARLAQAWSVTPEELGSFEAVPLPKPEDLLPNRYGDFDEVRAGDYNLFAQDAFSKWVRLMVAAIRSTGSKQLIDVGQDEGGVANRVLNQFYGGSGVSFTTNHTYWQDDALLWDSLVAKRPGIPNIVGETGYQPVWKPDGEWRYDEFTGFALLQRKWALGFAAANSGSLQWDWALEPDFGMKRSDGSSKIWEDMMREMGGFATKAAGYAGGPVLPDAAIVLPQSLQLSVYNAFAVEAQQKCVRALYQYARAEAYAVGEDQISLLGNPKLIILPSPWVFNQTAWEQILDKVRNGAVLLLSGRFDQDPQFHPTGRQKEAGIDYVPSLLASREDHIKWPGGEAWLTYSGDKTTFLERASLSDGDTFAERTLGKGKVLFVPLPLELNDNLQAVGGVYRFALQAAGVRPVYSTTLGDPGIMISPTRFPHATLYVLTSESNQAPVSFRDGPSGRLFSGKLDPGGAALLLVGEKGELLASYNWK